MAFTPGSLFRHVVTGTLFAIAVADQLLGIGERILLRRVRRAGRLKGRHSVTGPDPDL
ncbi:hypothetical protein OG689_04680 [Kitasatospora sp. NBC_00240]|uniref:hypothetical protein n=1 Tax=Kitasatospora sp. NBC_00240 TaxID=2903567 RepID=UPI00224E42AB|nr:hypothetical protein [Kitasatospora sp. NBC_00240]MCX5208596.1 hypothetical protein [Kitasatospora sp. NBC_00240]